MVITDFTPTAIGMSIETAVAVAGIGRTRLYGAIQRGELVARKCGRRTVILRADLEAWLHSLPPTQPSRPTGGTA
jgi:excisionase family DNA binding protein